MLSLLPGGRIPVAVETVDGRKGIDSLAGVVRSVLKGDPLSGDLFVFRNRRGDKLKILAWMGDGFALYLRRLERGTFAFPTVKDASVLVTPTQLAMILGGLDPANWLQIGGDGGLKTASVLLSVCASATRHRLNPWSYLHDLLDQLAGRTAKDDVADLLPDAWAISHGRTG
jgi:transposase